MRGLCAAVAPKAQGIMGESLTACRAIVRASYRPRCADTQGNFLDSSTEAI
jgi:hypothetical protein